MVILSDGKTTTATVDKQERASKNQRSDATEGDEVSGKRRLYSEVVRGERKKDSLIS